MIAFWNQSVDHTGLGHLTLPMADTFKSVVDVGGALLPPLPDALTRHRGMWLWEQVHYGTDMLIEPGSTHDNIGAQLGEECACLIDC